MTTDAKELKKAHGLTPSEMYELQQKQVAGEQISTVAASRKKGFQVEKHEAHLVHVEQERRQFDSSTGVKLSTPFVQKYTPKEYEEIKKSGALAGYTTEVLHSPEDAKVEEGGVQLGEASEGVRKVHSNYSALQERYEGFTGEKPDPTYTEAQLDRAVQAAEKVWIRSQDAARNLKPIDESQALQQQVSPIAPIVVDEADASKEGAAKLAAEVAEHTPPTTDGRTSVGEATPVQIANAIEAGSTEAAAEEKPAAVVAAEQPAAVTKRRTGSKPGVTAAE